MDIAKAHALYGMAQFGFTLVDVEIDKKLDTDGCVMTTMTFIDGYDDYKEIVVKTDNMESAERVKNGIEFLSNMDYLRNSDVDIDFDKEFYYAKVYNIQTDTTYQKILKLDGNRFNCSSDEEVLVCKPVPDSLYHEASIANDINSSINSPLSMKYYINYEGV